ncbi:MAG: hypothetical protein WC785_06365 [Tatlockia sp.]
MKRKRSQGFPLTEAIKPGHWIDTLDCAALHQGYQKKKQQLRSLDAAQRNQGFPLAVTSQRENRYQEEKTASQTTLRCDF